MSTGIEREKSKLTVASTVENASDSDRNSKSAAEKLAAKVERFKQSRKVHSETRIVGGVAINTTVDSNVPLSVQSSSVSVKSEPELDNIKDKVNYEHFFIVVTAKFCTPLKYSSFSSSSFVRSFPPLHSPPSYRFPSSTPTKKLIFSTTKWTLLVCIHFSWY